MSTTILEALQELETSRTIGKYTQKSLKERNTAYLNESLKRKKKVSERVDSPVKEAILADLWEQVYASLTDCGDDRTYLALGKLRGNNKYAPEEVTVPKREWNDGISVISVQSDDLDWAKHIAEVYGLTSEEHEGQLDIFVPFGEEVRYDLIVPAWREKIKKSIDRVNRANESYKRRPARIRRANESYKSRLPRIDRARRLKESVESSMPVNVLSEREIIDYIRDIPASAPGRPPKFFKLGYISEITANSVASKYRGGRGSSAETPKVRVFKCTEYSQLYTGADWRNTNATKTADKILGTERHTGERTGFRFDREGEEADLVNKIGKYMDGSKCLQAYIGNGSRQKVRYYISLNDEDLREASLDEIVQYCTPAVAAKLTGPRVYKPAGQDAAGNDVYDKPINRFKLSGIYMLGNLGHPLINH